jgi:hypothetical protein
MRKTVKKTDKKSIPLDLYYNPEENPELKNGAEIHAESIGLLLVDYWKQIKGKKTIDEALIKAMSLAKKDNRLTVKKSVLFYSNEETN